MLARPTMDLQSDPGTRRHEFNPDEQAINTPDPVPNSVRSPADEPIMTLTRRLGLAVDILADGGNGHKSFMPADDKSWSRQGDWRNPNAAISRRRRFTAECRPVDANLLYILTS